MTNPLSEYTHNFTPAEARALAVAIGEAARAAMKPRWWTPSTPEELAAADARVKACVAEMIGGKK